jgi:hypothetical protein
MKTLFIIDTYPSTPKQVKILNECIDAIRHCDVDIMIVSHLPIDADTSKKVEYVIYDGDNSFLPPEYTPFFFLNTDQFDLTIFTAGHTLPICRNIKNSLSLAKALGYQRFVFTECDVIFHPKDLKKLEYQLFKMAVSGKKMLFFKPEYYRGTNNSYVYETLLFAGDVEFFLNKFTPPVTTEQWLFMEMGYTLEQSFFEKFGDEEDKYLIINYHSSEIFRDSRVNLYRYGLFNCEMVYSETHPDEPILFIMNSLIEDEAKFIDIIVNGQPISLSLMKSQFWFNSYKFDGTEITVNVWEDAEKQTIFMSKTFNLHPENVEDFKQKGIIKLK